MVVEDLHWGDDATRELLLATHRLELVADDPPVRETYPVGGWARVPVLLHRR